jgi:hypothetical protein
VAVNIARALLLGTEVQEQNITGDAESESLVDKGRKLGFALHEPGYGQSRRVRLTEGILDGSGGTSSKRLIRHADSAGRLEYERWNQCCGQVVKNVRVEAEA